MASDNENRHQQDPGLHMSGCHAPESMLFTGRSFLSVVVPGCNVVSRDAPGRGSSEATRHRLENTPSSLSGMKRWPRPVCLQIAASRTQVDDS
jgi:hypothetical protein